VSEIGGLRRRVPPRARAVAATLGLVSVFALGCSADEAGDAAAAGGTAAAIAADGEAQPPAAEAADAADGEAQPPAAEAADAPAIEAFAWPTGPRPIATLVVAGFGEVEIELYPELAPETVANFVKLSREGFYEGTTFHRVIPGFMIQGGDPNTKDANPRNDGAGGPGYSIDDELSDAPHVRGVVSMANLGRPNSGGSQFFIVLDRQPHLDGHHTIFGRVSRGSDVVDAIAAVETDVRGRFGPPHRPLAPVVLERVVVEEPATTPSSPAAP